MGWPAINCWLTNVFSPPAVRQRAFVSVCILLFKYLNYTRPGVNQTCHSMVLLCECYNCQHKTTLRAALGAFKGAGASATDGLVLNAKQNDCH